MKKRRVSCLLCASISAPSVNDDDGELPLQGANANQQVVADVEYSLKKNKPFNLSRSSLVQKGVSLLASKGNDGGGSSALPSAPPFPFCVNCQGLVAELGELQAQLESLQGLIEAKLWTVLKKLEENTASSASTGPRRRPGSGRKKKTVKEEFETTDSAAADADGAFASDCQAFHWEDAAEEYDSSPDREEWNGTVDADDDDAPISRTRRRTRKNVRYNDFLWDEDEDTGGGDSHSGKRRRFEGNLRHNKGKRNDGSCSELLLVEDLEGSEPLRLRLAEKKPTVKDIKRKIDGRRSDPVIILKDLKTIISSNKQTPEEEDVDLAKFRFRVEKDAKIELTEDSEQIVLKMEPEDLGFDMEDDSDNRDSDYVPPDDECAEAKEDNDGYDENRDEDEVEDCDNRKADKSNSKPRRKENDTPNASKKRRRFRPSFKAMEDHNVTTRYQYKMACTKEFTIVEGKKFFLCYEFEEDDQGISCGFPACSFKVLKSSPTNLPGDRIEDFDEQMIHHVRMLHVPELINADKEMNARMKDKKHRCHMCDIEKVMNIDELRIHCVSKHQFNRADPLFQVLSCYVCGKKLATLDFHYKHMWSHYNESETTAMQLQGFGFSRGYQKEKTAGLSFQCPHCDKVCAEKHNLAAHLKTHIDKSLRPKFLCDICGKEMTTKRGITLHKSQHNPTEFLGKWKQCLQCDKKFLSSTHLRAHMALRHGGVKEYMCEICGKSFGKKEYLNRHSTAHQPPDFVPFDCHLCSDKYRYYQGLRRHITSAHGPEHKPLPRKTYMDKVKNQPVVHTCRQMFPCLECDEIFEMPRKLYYHRIIHKDVNHNKKCEEQEDEESYSYGSDVDMI